jgi:hypothetical protein
MYVDGGAIFASGSTWPEVESALASAYTTCTIWLVKSALATKPDKTKLIYFRRRLEKVDPLGARAAQC